MAAISMILRLQFSEKSSRSTARAEHPKQKQKKMMREQMA